MPRRILILAGTTEARLLANRLVEQGFDVISSFAGVTAEPKLPIGEIRVGGFGGVEGLRQFISEKRIEILVDATHPFAAQISKNAAEAFPKVMRLERVAWSAQSDANWVEVSDVQAALEALPSNARVMLTIGRKEISGFISRTDLSGVVRMIEPPEFNMLSNWKLILQRPPFTFESEVNLMRDNKISHLVTKNAGGGLTTEKLMAAGQLGIPVVMIARPIKPAVPVFHTIDAIAGELSSRYS